MKLKEKLLYRYDYLHDRLRDLPSLSDNGIISLADEIDSLYWEVAKHSPKDDGKQPRELDKTLTDMKNITSIKRRSQLSTHKSQWKEDLSIDMPIIKRMIDMLVDNSLDDEI